MAALTHPGEQKRLALWVDPALAKCQACGDFGTIEKPGWKRQQHSTVRDVIDHEVLCTCAAADLWRAIFEEWAKPVFDRWGKEIEL